MLFTISRRENKMEKDITVAFVNSLAEMGINSQTCYVFWLHPNFDTFAFFAQVSLLEENIKPRRDLPPLLVHLRERRPERLHYLGVSFGLTMDLFRFWRKHKFAPFYICQIPVKILHFTFSNGLLGN